MTITTDMLLAAGCEIKQVEWGVKFTIAYDLNGTPVAEKFNDCEWGLILRDWLFHRTKPRFRVKAKSVPFAMPYEDWRAIFALPSMKTMWDQTIVTNAAGRVIWPQKCRS